MRVDDGIVLVGGRVARLFALIYHTLVNEAVLGPDRVAMNLTTVLMDKPSFMEYLITVEDTDDGGPAASAPGE